MVKITVDLEEKHHQILRCLAKKNKRSMKNELLILIERDLDLNSNCLNSSELRGNAPFSKKNSEIEVSTLFMDGASGE